VRLNHEEAVESVEQLRPFIEFAKTAGMDGVGWSRDCRICGEDPWDIHRQDIVDICLLMGEAPGFVSKVWGVAADDMFRHRTHFINAFWSYGMGGRVASDGHWVTFPKDGTEEQRFTWYRGQAQLLAFQASKAKDLKEVRNNLKLAMDCDKALAVLAREPKDMKRALDLSPDQAARIEDAEKRRHQAMLDNLTPATKVESGET